LRDRVVQAALALEELARMHHHVLGQDIAETITDTVADVRRRLDKKELSVVVVGEKKAGKSTFLNAILGVRVLGTAVREYTGVVTFIHRAPRPTYRASLRDGRTEAFQDSKGAEAPERARVAAEIETLCKVLGIPLPAPLPSGCDIAPLLAEAKANLGEASRRRAAAEDAARNAEARLAQVDLERQQIANELAAVSLALTQDEQKLSAVQTQVAQAKAHLQAATSRLAEYAKSHAFQLPASIDGQRLPAAKQALQAAKDRLDTAPFFFHPAPWWQFWVFALRLLFVCFARDRLQAFQTDRQEHRAAELLVEASEASAGLEAIEHEETAHGAQLRRTRERLTSANELARTAEERHATAQRECPKAHALVMEARRAEDLRRLELLLLHAAEIEARLLSRFCKEIHDLTDMDKRGPEVKELHIGFPAVHLPNGITIIDTPGVNTDNAPNRERVWDLIRRDADGCILVSSLGQVVSQSTSEFLQKVRPIIPHILLVLSQLDRVIESSIGPDSIEQAEEARRFGVKRFAKEVGRPPKEIFSIAVAAEPALQGDTSPDGFGHRFSAEVTKLFGLLQSERAIVLSARAATAIGDCVRRIGKAEKQAEQSYRQRIDELERQRLPNPREFQAQQLAKIEGKLQEHADDIKQHALEVMREGVDQLKREWIRQIRACESKDGVKATIARLGNEGERAMANVMSRVSWAVQKRSSDSIKQLESPLFKELRKRYRIVQRMAASGRGVHLPSVDDDSSATAHVMNLRTGLDGAVGNFEGGQIALGVGGAAAGALVGTLLFPGVGTLIGAGLGALSGFFMTLDSLKSDCVTQIEKTIGDAKTQLENQLATVGPDVQRAMRDALGHCLTDEVARFQSWIDKVMAAERKLIEQERGKLSHLIQSRDSLLGHSRSLKTLQGEAAAVSQGLCGVTS
jgi:hypothetical protein